MTPSPSTSAVERVLTPELLESSALIVRERGLCQLAYADATGAVCILGAIAVARGYTPENDPGEWWKGIQADEFIEEPLAELAALMGRDPVAFSDDDGRTADEVADALIAAARSADA